MIDRFDALAALHSAGTMGRAAAVLHITQSAVSKRIAALELEVGATLIERQGRRVRLTPQGEQLLAQARPLLASLRELLRAPAAARQAPIAVAASDSLLASWLPGLLRHALDRLPGVDVELHAHHGRALVEHVRSGDYAIGFCPSVAGDKELSVREVGREPMVVVPSRLQTLARPSGPEALPVWAIAAQSLTWEATAARLRRLPRTLGFGLRIEGRLESFTALVQVARAGFGHALVPVGVARDLGVPSDRLLKLGELSRPIAVVGRRTSFERPAVKALLAQLTPLWPQVAERAVGTRHP